MGYPHCASCRRAFRALGWIDARTGEIATARALRDDHARQLCWDCADAVRERRERARVEA